MRHVTTLALTASLSLGCNRSTDIDSQSASSIAASSVSEGSVSESTVVPSDSSSVYTPPSTPGIAIEPTAPRSGQDLHCAVVENAEGQDGTMISYIFRWLVDGEPFESATNAADESVVPGWEVRAGDEWTCLVTAFDGTSEGPEASAGVSVITWDWAFVPETDQGPRWTSALFLSQNGDAWFAMELVGAVTLGETEWSNLSGTGALLVNVTEQGEFRSAAAIHSDQYTQVKHILEVEDGLIVGGNFRNQASFGEISLSTAGGNDLFVAKLGLDGEWKWAVRAGGADWDNSAALLPVSDGVLVTGGFGGTGTFGSTSLVSAGSQDIFVAKVSDAGAWSWAARAGGPNADTGVHLAAVDDGVIVAGTFTVTAGVGSTKLTGAGAQDIFVAKINDAGSWVWATSAGGPDMDQVNAIIPHEAQILVAGSFRNDAVFGETELTGNGSFDIFVASLSATGEWQWVSQAGGAGWDYPAQALLTEDGLILTGGFEETMTVDEHELTSLGDYDIFVTKVGFDGEWLWATRAGGAGGDHPWGLAPSGDQVVFGGEFEQEADFDAFSLPATGANHALIAKIDGDGQFSYAAQLGESGSSGWASVSAMTHNRGAVLVHVSVDAAWSLTDSLDGAPLVSFGDDDWGSVILHRPLP